MNDIAFGGSLAVTNNLMNKTLEKLTRKRDYSLSVFILLIITYIVVTFVVATLSRSASEVAVFGQTLPLNAFAGVFSSVTNICVIFMAFYYGKKGYFTALTLLLTQFPFVIMSVVRWHNTGSLPGVFGNVLAVVAITIILINNNKIAKYQETLRIQAVTDRLTGLPNRFACSEIINSLTEKGDRFIVVSIDLNSFKGINDTMGMKAGNQVLCEIASRWKTIAEGGETGTSDFITRISGDEFVLVIRDYDSDEQVMNTIKRYEAALNDRLTVDGCDLYITASFGYAEFPSDADTKDLLFTMADAAMHEVKRAASSDRIMRFTPEILKAERTLELEAKIREALEKEELFFHLQPQYDMQHNLRGFEALARMKDQDGSFINPAEFIPVAEKTGLIDRVDAMVIRKACSFFGELTGRTGKDLTLSVNISVRHLMKNDFFDEIKDVLKSSSLPADKLEIEITESIMIDSVDKALSCIDELKAIGIKIAIDDFGTGYSSLSYLNSFPADILKIDKSFIDKMDESRSSRQYVSAIISIGHIMGFKVISEGAEKTSQIDTLTDIGCDYVQGFVWGKPLTSEDAAKLVEAID